MAAWNLERPIRIGLKVIAYNLETSPVRVTMTGWNIDPGVWEITQGIDTNDDDVADQSIARRRSPFEKTESLELTLPPRATTIRTLKLRTPGIPYWQRPDVGIDPNDVAIHGNEVQVTVHSLGSMDAPPPTVSVMDRSGRTLASAPVPALKAPVDLMPKTTTVTPTVPAGAQLTGGSVVFDPGTTVHEITRRNNRVEL